MSFDETPPPALLKGQAQLAPNSPPVPGGVTRMAQEADDVKEDSACLAQHEIRFANHRASFRFTSSKPVRRRLLEEKCGKGCGTQKRRRALAHTQSSSPKPAFSSHEEKSGVVTECELAARHSCLRGSRRRDSLERSAPRP